MNIQGVSQSIPAGSSRQSDPRLKSLDQQINNIQKSIQETRKNDKLDPKSKSEKIKEYEQQIQALQQEKAQIQAESRTSAQKPAESKQPSADQEVKDESNAVNAHVQNAFVKMESMKNTDKALGFVREQAKGDLRIAESKSYLRDPDPKAAAAAREKLARIDRAVLRKAEDVKAELKESEQEAVSAPKDAPGEEESGSGKTGSGTGRMEPGQFLNGEA